MARSNEVRFLACRRDGLVRRTIHRSQAKARQPPSLRRELGLTSSLVVTVPPAGHDSRWADRGAPPEVV